MFGFFLLFIYVHKLAQVKYCAANRYVDQKKISEWLALSSYFFFFLNTTNLPNTTFYLLRSYIVDMAHFLFKSISNDDSMLNFSSGRGSL